MKKDADFAPVFVGNLREIEAPRRNTLLQKLGGGDPDRSELHDLACQYIAQKEQIERIWRHVFETPAKLHSIRIERPLSKGEGKYKTTIGFIDVWAEWEITPKRICYGPKGDAGCALLLGTKSYCSHNHVEPETVISLIEVKTGVTPIGEILRQIHLYGEYVDENRTHNVVVFTCEIPESLRTALESEQIKVLALGSAFHEWCASQRKKAKVTEL